MQLELTAKVLEFTGHNKTLRYKVEVFEAFSLLHALYVLEQAIFPRDLV